MTKTDLIFPAFSSRFVDFSVSFGFFDRFQGFGADVSCDLVWVVHGNDTWFIQRDGDFIDDVGLEKVKVQLGFSTCVQGESTYLAFAFPLVGSVPVILGASGSEFHDMIVGFQFAGEFAEIIASG